MSLIRMPLTPALLNGVAVYSFSRRPLATSRRHPSSVIPPSLCARYRLRPSSLKHIGRSPFSSPPKGRGEPPASGVSLHTPLPSRVVTSHWPSGVARPANTLSGVAGCIAPLRLTLYTRNPCPGSLPVARND